MSLKWSVRPRVWDSNWISGGRVLRSTAVMSWHCCVMYAVQLLAQWSPGPLRRLFTTSLLPSFARNTSSQ